MQIRRLINNDTLNSNELGLLAARQIKRQVLLRQRLPYKSVSKPLPTGNYWVTKVPRKKGYQSSYVTSN